MGVTTMLGLTAGLRCGLDVQGMLEGWGFGAALAGETAASLAAGCVQLSNYRRGLTSWPFTFAVLCNYRRALVASASSPLYLLSCGYAVPIFASSAQAVKDEVIPKHVVPSRPRTKKNASSSNAIR